jgi:TPR repeat protein
MKRFIIIVFALMIGAAVAAVAYPIVSPYHARLRTDFEDPKKREAALRQAVDFEKTHYKALMGDKVEQYKFGLVFLSGELGFRDATQAFGWFARSAAQNYPLAEFALAHAYLSGDGIAKDEAQGAGWAEKASVAGIPQARELMGLLFTGAIGEQQDMIEGLSLLKQAQTSESLGIAMEIDNKNKAIYALPTDQRDAELKKLADDVKTDVRGRFPGIEKKLAEAALVPQVAAETASAK